MDRVGTSSVRHLLSQGRPSLMLGGLPGTGLIAAKNAINWNQRQSLRRIRGGDRREVSVSVCLSLNLEEEGVDGHLDGRHFVEVQELLASEVGIPLVLDIAGEVRLIRGVIRREDPVE